ncbi:CHASE3 domain-containing protein [Sphingomonas sp. NFR15]|uniref:sensor histidine kinase n=1 Tax=Sphingomonas sp. NFR15 TaxID=1566282 RepID=UPI00088DF8B6|nr:CHASE3 domain-containing protein [Sphingomonas sp. NFR15]SDA35155.1 PAS domain S-box-containing protein [Sphingomonas sp. NFR15]
MNTIPVFKADWEPKLWRTMAVASALSGALVLLAVVFGVEYNHSTATSANVNRTYRERVEIDALGAALTDAELAQRGYIITGDAAFLVPYHAARARFDRVAEALGEAFRRRPDQRERLRRLHALAAAKFAAMERANAVRGSRGPAAAAAAIGAGEEKRLMAAIAQTQGAILAEQGRILDTGVTRQRARILATKRLIWGLVLTMTVSTFALGYLFWRTRRRNHALTLKAVRFGTRQNAIFAAAQDAIVLLNPDGGIEMVNPAAEHLFGYPANALLHRDVALLADLAPGDGAFLDRIGYRSTGLANPFRTNLHARRRDGAVLPIEVSLGAMDLPDGVHIVAAFRDVTERERAEDLRRRFLSTVSHELRTPLTSIVGALGLLRGDAVSGLHGDVRRLVVIAESNAVRLIRLVNDLLDIEKLEAGAMRFDFQMLDLRSAMREAAETMRGLAETRGIVLRMEAGDTPVMVRGDSGRLVQVASNLLSNAVRFSRDGGVVTLSLHAASGRATVSVQDHGPGIDPELGRRLFTRFGQGQCPAGVSAGTGLGLTIAREIVRAHGGRIWHAPAREGALFCFDLAVAGAAPVTLVEGTFAGSGTATLDVPESYRSARTG